MELVVKNSPANARDIKDVGSIPGLGRCPGGGHGNPLHYSCLGNIMDRGAWLATIHGVAKSWTYWSNLACTHTWYTNDTFFIVCFIFLPWIWIFISWLTMINATPWVAGQWRKNTVLQRSFWNKINIWAWTANFAVLSLFFMFSSCHHNKYPGTQSVVQLFYFNTYISQNLKTSPFHVCWDY